jgi:hypothetical protein
MEGKNQVVPVRVNDKEFIEKANKISIYNALKNKCEKNIK